MLVLWFVGVLEITSHTIVGYSRRAVERIIQSLIECCCVESQLRFALIFDGIALAAELLVNGTADTFFVERAQFRLGSGRCFTVGTKVRLIAATFPTSAFTSARADIAFQRSQARGLIRRTVAIIPGPSRVTLAGSAVTFSVVAADHTEQWNALRTLAVWPVVSRIA